MESVEIISKEVITRPALWPMIIVSVIAIIGVIVTLIINLKQRKKTPAPSCIPMFCFGFGGLIGQLIAFILASMFLQLPTGQYTYRAIVNTNNISIEEYEQFIEQNKPEIDNGIYTWVGD